MKSSVRYMGSFDLAVLKETDAVFVSEIEKEALKTEGWSEKSVAETMKNGGMFFGAYSGEKLVSTIGIMLAADEAYVTNVATVVSERRKGAAESLIEYVKSFLRGKAAFLSLEVRASNEGAIRLYDKCGFIKAGVRPDFYKEPLEDAVIMTYYFE